jgi:hypothetical protein
MTTSVGMLTLEKIFFIFGVSWKSAGNPLEAVRYVTS